MREDVDPGHSRPLCHLPVPPFLPVASGGCLPPALPVFCSFALFMLIYLLILLLRQCPTCLGELCVGRAAWPLGEHWAGAASQELSVPLALSSSSSWL